MLKVLTAEQMREVDRLTTERYGIPSLQLMENAAHAVARVITEKLGGSVKDKSILILCGKGNNGGDGAALARILHEAGAKVTVELFAKISDTVGDARENWEKLQHLAISAIGTKLSLLEIRAEISDNGVSDWMDNSDYDVVDILVDALFGTGLVRHLNGFFDEVVGVINDWKQKYGKPLIVSIDVPSGLNADVSNPLGANIHADTTMTFTAPKSSNLLPPASTSNGEIVIASIGSPQELIDEQPSQLFLAERKDADSWLKKTKFSDNSYKNKRGHSLVIAGSDSYSGAAVMSGNAAMRSGVGLVTLAVPRSCKAEIASRTIPEVIVHPIDEDGNGELSDDAYAFESELIGKANAIAVGCGLSATDKGVEKLVREIVEKRTQPVIVDAGALWFFNPPAKTENHPVGETPPPLLRKDGSSLSPLILTPHEGEFLRLLGTTDKEAIKDRVAAVRDFATTHNVILVLKGERVLIGSPDGRVVVNPTGNSGLGKAGNGDTLAGVLAGFVVQANAMKIDIFETVVAAVYVAGMAGDIAEKKYGKRVMTASDVRECLKDVFSELEGK